MARSVGVMLPRDLPAARVLPYARAAEQAGFDELWVVEDCFFRGGIAQAGAVLAATERITVGIGILPAAVRNAAFTTLELATLAELFPGRLLAGIGHGMPLWMKQVGAWPSSPLGVLEEHLTVVRDLLHGATVTTAGPSVHLDGVRLETPPVSPPPVLAGVRGPRSLQVAGRCADGTVLAEPVTPEYARWAREQIAAPGPHLVVGYNVAAVDDRAEVARDAARSALEWIGEQDWAPHIAPLPFAAEFAALRERCADRHEFVRALPDAWVDQLAVTGTPEQARGRIGELHDAGVDSVVLVPVGPDPDEALRSLARLLS